MGSDIWQKGVPVHRREHGLLVRAILAAPSEDAHHLCHWRAGIAEVEWGQMGVKWGLVTDGGLVTDANSQLEMIRIRIGQLA